MLPIKLFCLCTLFIMDVRATTHWMVTENGLIQPRAGSPFEMARPYDLLAFLNQDTRWEKIVNLYYDLKSRKEIIRKLWSYIQRDGDLDVKIQSDSNCVEASPLNSIDWYSSELYDGKMHDDISFDYFEPTKLNTEDDIDIPDCKKISSLTFSMHSFEHLEGMVERQNLTAEAEYMYFSIGRFQNINQYGHWVAKSLKKNSTSWVHYNMASLYWRVQGNAPKAMECSRRAVHYAPREHKDIPLLSMGSILLRSNKIEDAIVVLGAAYYHAPKILLNNYVLGNAYAVAGNYNISLKLFTYCEDRNPFLRDVTMKKHAILCHAALQDRALLLQKYMEKFLSEISEFGQIEAHWLKSQAAFLRNMHHKEKFDYTNIEKNCEKMSELTGFDIKELKKEGDRNSYIQYILDGPLYSEEWLHEKGVYAFRNFYRFHRLVRHIESQLNEISDYVTKPFMMISDDNMRETSLPDFIEFPKASAYPEVKSKNNQGDDTHEYEAGLPLYPSSINVDRNTEDFDVEQDWPTAQFCNVNSYQFPEDGKLIYPVFLPFENKGIRLLTVLSNKIGVPVDTEHDLPWHPPTCVSDKESFTIKKSHKMQMTNEVASTESLKRKLLEYVSDGYVDKIKHMQEAEIGHRIFSAIQMKVAPKWILYTLASLYWRVRNNNVNAVTCLLAANKTVPARHRDVVLISLASVYLEIGYFDDALLAAEKAYHVTHNEPSTNFVLAQMNMVMKHFNAQLYHLKQVLRVEPLYMEGLARNIINALACNLKSEDPKVPDGCNKADPSMNMVCEGNGLNCRITNMHCFKNVASKKEPIEFLNSDRSDEILKMLTQKEEAAQLHDGTLESFVEDIRHTLDPLGHRQNYERMRENLNTLLSECGPDGCLDLKAGDVSMKKEDCGYQHLQISYWLHIVSFRQLIADAQFRLPPEVISLTPSSKKVPECSFAEHLGENHDFFFEKLKSINSDEWEPLLNLMQLVVELFDYFDYVTLGAKIAKYVDDNPREWMGLLAAGWWCGAGGHGVCCVQCITAAYLYAPLENTRATFLSIAAITHMQSKLEDAKDIAYLMFYLSPKSKVEAYMVAVAHTYMSEYEQAIWMYRYSLTIDENYLPAKACLHATMCLMFFGEKAKSKAKFNFNIV